MIPIISDLISQPGVMVGMSLGICIGLVIRGNFMPKFLSTEGKNEDGEEDFDEDSDSEWDEDGFLSEDGGDYKLVLVVRTDLKMGKGKAAAQCSHATLKAYMQQSKKSSTALKSWLMNGQPKVVLKIGNEEALLDLAAESRKLGLTTSLIQDAGRTQIEPGSRTVLGVGPGPVEMVDLVTGHLKLY